MGKDFQKIDQTQDPWLKQNKGSHQSILWIEATAFSAIIALSWVVEIIGVPHLIFGEAFTPNWNRAILRTVVIGLIWFWVHTATKKLLKRLHYLEQFMRVCSWCRRVSHEDEWLTMEAFFSSRFATQTSHGMCPDCLHNSEIPDDFKKGMGDVAPQENRSPNAK